MLLKMRGKVRLSPLLLFLIFLACFIFISRRTKTTPEDIEIKEIEDIKLLYDIEPGPVYLGKAVIEGVDRKTGTAVALKMIPRRFNLARSIRGIKNEAIIWKMVAHHQGVCRLEKIVQTPGTVYIVMEKLDQSLSGLIKYKDGGAGLAERKAKFFVAQIAVVLKNLHRKNIIHHDLSLGNVLLTKESTFPQIKLCDFQFSVFKPQKLLSRALNYIFSPKNLTPELNYDGLLPQELHHIATANFGDEMERFGNTIYHLLGGRKSFTVKNNVGKNFRNQSLMYPLESWENVSKQGIDLIDELLACKPGESLTIDHVIQHDWFQDPVLFQDLKKVEERVRVQYLVHEFDRK